jgi:hypothetical protein
MRLWIMVYLFENLLVCIETRDPLPLVRTLTMAPGRTFEHDRIWSGLPVVCTRRLEGRLVAFSSCTGTRAARHGVPLEEN